MFGKNKIALPSITAFHELLARQYEDENVIYLIIAATLYLMFSMFSNSKTAYIETLTIYVGVFFAAFVAAMCDWIKERQFLKIKDEVNNAQVLVYRGTFGSCVSISVRDLVVGDLIDIQQGDRIPADCVIIEETNIKVDQSMYNPQETFVEKSLSNTNVEYGPDNHKTNPDPFLLSASKIMSGSGRAIVCSVGDNTRLSRSTNKEDLVIKEQQTFLEQKLEDISNAVTQYALLLTSLIIVVLSLYMVVRIMFNSSEELISVQTLLNLAKIVIIACCILIVAIPEGLPLAVSIAMALSINKLKNDEILIKNVDAVQTAAMIHDVCVGKSGIITTGEMHVGKFQFCDSAEAHLNDWENEGDKFCKSFDIQSDLKNLIIESIVANSDVRMEINDSLMTYEPHGDSIEVAMMNFLIENDEDAN